MVPQIWQEAGYRVLSPGSLEQEVKCGHKTDLQKALQLHVDTQEPTGH